MSKAKAAAPQFAKMFPGFLTIFVSPKPNVFHSTQISTSEQHCHNSHFFSWKQKVSKMALQYFKTKSMAEQISHFSMNADTPMQTKVIYLSSDENAESQCSISDQYLPEEDNDTQYQPLHDFEVHPNHPTDVGQVTI